VIKHLYHGVVKALPQLTSALRPAPFPHLNTRTRRIANTAGARSLIPPRETGILNVRSHAERRASMGEYEADLQNQPVDVSEEFAGWTVRAGRRDA
jgi:hypothetical protein